jgi:hypothetical protein
MAQHAGFGPGPGYGTGDPTTCPNYDGSADQVRERTRLQDKSADQTRERTRLQDKTAQQDQVRQQQRDRIHAVS